MYKQKYVHNIHIYIIHIHSCPFTCTYRWVNTKNDMPSIANTLGNLPISEFGGVREGSRTVLSFGKVIISGRGCVGISL